MLQVICFVGALLAALAVAGIIHAAIFSILWILYLSLFHVGQTFSSFQWDILLLEAGNRFIVVAHS